MRFSKYLPILLFTCFILPYHQITNIKIIGNKKTKDYIILREIEHPIPGIYNSNLSKKDENKIYNLNLFSTVNIDTANNTYIVNVSENFYFFPVPIINYDETTGTSYGAAISDINFRGRDETIVAGFISGNSDEYFLSYTNPWIYGDHISLGFDFQKLYREHHAYSIIDDLNNFQLSTGFHVNSSHKFKFISGYSSHLLDNNINKIYKYYNLNFRYKYDTRDIYLDPTKGVLMNLKFNNFIGISDTKNIHQFEFNSTYFKSINNNFLKPVLRYRSTIYLQTSNDNIPLFHKKYLGGHKLVKGYSKTPAENGKFSQYTEVDNFLFNSITLQGTIIPRQIFFSILKTDVVIGSDFRFFIDHGIGSLQKQQFNLGNGIIGYGIGNTLFIGGGKINIDLAFNESGEYRIHLYGNAIEF